MPPSVLGKGVKRMRGVKLSLVLSSVAVVALALWARAYVEQTGSHMAVAADRFLALVIEGAGRQGDATRSTHPSGSTGTSFPDHARDCRSRR